MILPPFIKKGDTVAIVATARSINYEQLKPWIDILTQEGYNVYLHEKLYEVEHQMAGSASIRASVLNEVFGNTNVKAVFCARGGYGTSQMIDEVDFNLLKNNPKWVCGFSDVTVLLSHIMANCNMACVHSSMPIFMHNKIEDDLLMAKDALSSLLHLLEGKKYQFSFQSNFVVNNQPFEGIITGGNLSVLMSAINTKSEDNWQDKILFLEDIDEYYYHIDRMMLTLKRSGKLSNIKALLVGSFQDMHDHTIPFGKNIREIILHHCAHYGYPIIFDVDCGHHLHNLALPFGVIAKYNNGILTFAN